MPKYLYKCRKCNIETSFFHSMTDRREDCEKCDSEQSLERMPSQFMTELKATTDQVGDTVNRTIKEFKADLEEQKEKLSNEFYSSDK